MHVNESDTSVGGEEYFYAGNNLIVENIHSAFQVMSD